jgi:hypothetical protein
MRRFACLLLFIAWSATVHADDERTANAIIPACKVALAKSNRGYRTHNNAVKVGVCVHCRVRVDSRPGIAATLCLVPSKYRDNKRGNTDNISVR